MVTTQGLMEVAKFLAVKGPRGTYSHFCTSRALQSFISTSPKSRSSASAIVRGRPVLREQGGGGGCLFVSDCLVTDVRTYMHTCIRTEGVGWPADEGAHLQLEVQEAAGPVHRALLLLVRSFIHVSMVGRGQPTADPCVSSTSMPSPYIVGRIGLELSVGPHDGRLRHHHARGPAMVAHRQVQPVGLQSVLLAPAQ